MSELIDNDHINMLIDKINLKEFESGAVFEMNTDNFDSALESAMKKESQSYQKETFSDNMDQMPITLLEEEDVEAPGSVDFETLALKMTTITDDGKLKKRVLRPGIGPVVPMTALVEIHYNAYYEYADEAFDSTYLRGQTHKFVPLTGDCIMGLCLAVTSMQKGEVSRFLIHHELGYGFLGIRPRIPPQAELLFEIQVINFIDGVETKTVDELNTNGTEEIDVDKVISAKHLEGNELFSRKEIREATAKYFKALSLIDECIQVKRGDLEKYKPRMLTLCANLALCHIKKENYVQAVKICERALSIKPDHCKSLFYYGRALLKLTEYDDAEVKLLKAQTLEPSNKDINSELLKLEVQRRQYNVKSKEMIERMFMKAKTDNSGIAAPLSKWHVYLSTFKNNAKDNNFVLPANIPLAELEEIDSEARRLGLIVCRDNERLVISKQK